MARLSCYGYNLPPGAIQVHHSYNSLELYTFLDRTVIYNLYNVSSKTSKTVYQFYPG